MPACLAPTCLLERPKLTRAMYQALKRHIMKERERKKQAEQEQDAMMDRLRKEREMRRKKEEEDSLTLEQTKEQVSSMEKKLETLKTEKHDLFSQLKKVLHQEDETRRRTQIKEQQSEMLMHAHQGYASHGIPVSGHPVMLQQISGRPALYKPPSSMIGVKRARSPSPPPTSSYQAYSYPPAKQGTPHIYQHQQAEFKQGNYPQGQPVHVTYTSQPGHSYQQQSVHTSSQSPASKYNQANQSAFTSYPAAYAQHQQKPQQPIENYPSGYMMHRMQQQAGYMGSAHNANIIQQQLEHASQKPSFSDDKYKLQQVKVREQPRSYHEGWPAAAYPFPRGGTRGKAPPQLPGQQPAMLQQQMQQIQQQTAASNKGSIVTGYPARTQAVPTSSAYQSPSQGNYHTQSQGRP